MDLTDVELLERHAPIVRFNEGEYFLPAAVEAFVGLAELWERTGPSNRELVAPAGTLDLHQLVELTDGHRARHYLRLVSEQPTSAELVAWKLRRDRPRFRAETRLGRVGVFARFVDAGARLSLLLRGQVPTGAQTAAAVLDRDRSDHGDHPYYGRVLRSAGYLILQYWYFSFFNDWRSRAHGVNDHEGDWEQVTVFCVEHPDPPPTPEWVAFSAHDEVGADLRRRWDDPDLTVIDGHPVVYPGLGSHAGAYLPGEYLIAVRGSRLANVAQSWRRRFQSLVPWWSRDEQEGFGIPYVEYCRGDGVAIGHRQQRTWRPVVISDDTPWVRQYSGLWGHDTNDPFGGERGPAGPRYERSGAVRQSWGDPIGWAALDRVVPGGAERRSVIEQRIVELDTELAAITDEQRALRGRLRAAVIGGATDVTDEEQLLRKLAERQVVRDDERRRLLGHLDREPTEVHPHAHLHHRNMPLPEDDGGRRRLLRIWATISTPLVFVLIGLLLAPTGASTWTISIGGLLLVFALEALARGRLLSFAFGLVALVAVSALTVAVLVGLVSSWRITIAALFGGLALVFLVLNLRELRRT